MEAPLLSAELQNGSLTFNEDLLCPKCLRETKDNYLSDEEQAALTLLTLSTLVDLIFLTDMILTFLTGFDLSNGERIWNPRMIVNNYIVKNDPDFNEYK